MEYTLLFEIQLDNFFFFLLSLANFLTKEWSSNKTDRERRSAEYWATFIYIEIRINVFYIILERYLHFPGVSLRFV